MKSKRTYASDAKIEAALQLLNRSYESSSGLTPEFKAFHSRWRAAMIAVAGELFNANSFTFHRGHFETSCFFHVPGTGWYYVATGDVRGRPMANMVLIRTAKDDKDYRGGCNMWLRTTSSEEFIGDLRKAVGV